MAQWFFEWNLRGLTSALTSTTLKPQKRPSWMTGAA
jgi:hypothetical protein